jgi:PPOX class probable F420-dependent enzyme
VLSAAQRRFIEQQRTAVLATVGPDGMPRLVPICFTLASAGATEPVLYTPLDDKPKATADVRALARVRDILSRPEVSLLFDHWDEDWSRLGWLRLGGRAALLEPTSGASHDRHRAAVATLRLRYPQYLEHAIDERPLITVTVTSVASWSASR